MNSLLLNDVLPPPGGNANCELPEGKRVTDCHCLHLLSDSMYKKKIGHEKKIRKKQTLFRGFHIYISLSRIHPS